MKRSILNVIIITFIAVFLTACSTGDSSSEDQTTDEITIYTTIYPLEYFTEQIGGEYVNVKSILPPGSDPHTYEPTTKEMVKMAEADAFIYSGATLEGYAEKISSTIQPEDVKVVEAAHGIDLEKHEHDGELINHAQDNDTENHSDSHEGHNHEGNDPHIWLDPLRSVQMAENIKDALVELKPEREALFNENFNDLKERLNELDQKYHEVLSSLPGDEIIVSHAAYGYWEQAYGLEQIAISGLDPSNEPSQKELERIIEEGKGKKIDHILFEQNVTPKIAKVVQKEIGADLLRVHNLSVRTEEDLKQEEDYFTLMDQNLEVLKKALSE
ncbi:metal ABC transporter solute-binding protein, Zn/Mn family [Halobacillus yeomjeoni]|uniref:Zinc ABC transporter substrate-binding protein n=1 Tax=Halobacillus yeomjeoni TaxID=311194 RepID=A0A931HWL1_9BACI|nr:zinc ABC transporter substrate-binding protein [Halobacillus yeomjeoni]MBH0231212.1 zinc ABC transporter substrate-binding protein [Halobacillus yeomjeoni]